ncbi:carbohydrate ABC transporter permease [Microbacterium sp.]|jgi:multiple sugar transport system permease protein|uniref:carbohydrate ABC transporter permease n=1 Tax=Microbacterium sp. TaxID=51671 RepID=UPI003C76AE13
MTLDTVAVVTGGRKNRSGAPGKRAGRRFDPLPYILVAPVTLFIIILALVPAGYTIVQSFFTVDALHPPERFSGLKNFRNLLADDRIMTALGNTAFYVVVGVTLSTVLGIAFAVALQRPFRGRGAVIAVLVLPWALPGVVNAILWSGILDANGSLVGGLMDLVGMGGDHVLLGQNPWLTRTLIVLVQVWQITPLSTLLILATLQLVPSELYEASSIDGAGRWRSFTSITLPLARAGIAVAMVQAVVQTLNIFDQPYVLNGSAAMGTSLTIETYKVSFQALNFGEGYALSLFIAVVTVVLSLAIIKIVYRKVEM